MNILTLKLSTLYVAYAPDSGDYFFGGCFEEALNGLVEQIRATKPSVPKIGEERNSRL